MAKAASLKHILARAACLPLLAGLTATPMAQDHTDLAAVPDAAREAAGKELQHLQKFPEFAPPHTLALETCVQVYLVGLDALGKYRDGQDPATLLRKSDVLCAVAIDGKINAEQRMAVQDDQWLMSSLAVTSYVETIDTLRAEFEGASKGQDVFRVYIQALGYDFLARQTDQGLLLKYTFAGLGHKPGDVEKAEDILRRLKPVALQYDFSTPG